MPVQHERGPALGRVLPHPRLPYHLDRAMQRPAIGGDARGRRASATGISTPGACAWSHAFSHGVSSRGHRPTQASRPVAVDRIVLETRLPSGEHVDRGLLDHDRAAPAIGYQLEAVRLGALARRASGRRRAAPRGTRPRHAREARRRAARAPARRGSPGRGQVGSGSKSKSQGRRRKCLYSASRARAAARRSRKGPKTSVPSAARLHDEQAREPLGGSRRRYAGRFRSRRFASGT